MSLLIPLTSIPPPPPPNIIILKVSSFLSRYKVLRRRIIWMTGQWINVKVSRLTRPLVYQVALKLMNAQEDLVVGNHHIKGLLQEGRKLLF